MRSVSAALLALAILGSASTAALAHGFGQRFDLPVPLWLWLTGAALTVVLSFATVIDFLPARLERLDYPRLELLRWRAFQLHVQPVLVGVARFVGVVLFVLTVAAGLFGDQEPTRNLAPTMMWVGFWVGMAFVSALLGDLWAVANPLRTLFQWVEALHLALLGRPLAPLRRYPAALGKWPAVALMLAFGWLENLADGAAVPRNVGLAMLGYLALTFAGMRVFGRETWLQNAEMFAVVFDLFGRFAPFEVRLVNAGAFYSSPPRAERSQDRVIGLAGIVRSPRDRWQLYLRPPAVGLLRDRDVSASMIVLVLVLLSGVTFDGFIETSLGDDLVQSLHGGGVLGAGVPKTVVMLLFPVLFLLAFGTCCVAMAGIAARGGARAPSAGRCARRFVMTLVPIAIAYHFAHYLTLLVTVGPSLIALISDPLALGWNLFGTAAYKAELEPIGIRTVWSLLVSAIVVGHVLAVYLAHVAALDLFGDRAVAIRTQIPLLILMVAYTMASLWIIAQPIVG